MEVIGVGEHPMLIFVESICVTINSYLILVNCGTSRKNWFNFKNVFNGNFLLKILIIKNYYLTWPHMF